MRPIATLGLLVLAALLAPPAPARPEPYDIVIVGGKVVDGTGNPWFYGDLAIEGERIVAIAPPGRIDPASAGTVVDAAGMVVAPGFIDIQSHSILPFFTENWIWLKGELTVDWVVLPLYLPPL